MDDRDKRGGPRRAETRDRAERLASALRANLKRRKAQARGRDDRAEVAGQGNSRLDSPHPESKNE